MIGYRGTERQIKWVERFTFILRAALVIYLIGWLYTIGRTWLIEGLAQEAVKSFALGLAVIGVIYFVDRRLSDFRHR